MYTLIVVLILIVCVLLAVVVLMQNSKGGGLAANFSAPNQIMGVRKTTDFFEKTTWILAAALVVLSLVATMSIPRQNGDDALSTEVSVSEKNLSPVQNNVPAAEPIQAPVQK